MRLAVILGSQRRNGTGARIEAAIRALDIGAELDFIRLAEARIEGCVACERCGKFGRCVLPPGPNDRFQEVLDRLVASDAILLATPIYAPYPSRLAALMERLTSVSFFPYLASGARRPLLGKKAAIICYGSGKIEDETQLKILFQKSLADEYSFSTVSYPYSNAETDPNAKYADAVEYAAAATRALCAGETKMPP